MFLTKKICSCDLGQNCNCMMRSLLCYSYRSQLLTGETHVSSSGVHQVRFTKSKSRSVVNSNSKSQRTNQPIPEHMDVVAHRALFCPLCLQPAVPLLLRRASNLPTQMLTCGDQSPSNGLHPLPIYWL